MSVDFQLAPLNLKRTVIFGKYLGNNKAVVFPDNIYNLEKFINELMGNKVDIEERVIKMVCQSITHEWGHIITESKQEWIPSRFTDDPIEGDVGRGG